MFNDIVLTQEIMITQHWMHWDNYIVWSVFKNLGTRLWPTSRYSFWHDWEW